MCLEAKASGVRCVTSYEESEKSEKTHEWPRCQSGVETGES